MTLKLSQIVRKPFEKLRIGFKKVIISVNNLSDFTQPLPVIVKIPSISFDKKQPNDIWLVNTTLVYRP